MCDQVSTRILECVDRFRAGDATAADDLFRTVGERLEHLARRMLAGFPTVRPVADAGDVVQGAAMRLLSALRQLRPQSSREFFNLAAVQIRRELLDLARRVACRTKPDSLNGDARTDFTDPAPVGDDLDRWTSFHEAVEKLPVEEREAIGLVYYHGRSRGEAAEILGVNERTISRWWQSGCERLKERLGGELPMA
jgi:RNA polymerase sigma factor (sigma-70 family)